MNSQGSPSIRELAKARHGATPTPRRPRLATRLIWILLGAGTLAPSANAQVGGPWDLSWHTADTGGGQSGAGPWHVHATLGQADASSTLAGGSWSLALGFWGADDTPVCVADVDDGSATGTPDASVDISDLLYYLQLFDAGDPAADFDDGSGLGLPDGGVDISDLLYFLARFDAGC